MQTENVAKRLFGSVLLLFIFGVLFSIPFVTLSLSAHGVVPALIAFSLVLASALIGPLSFAFSSAFLTDIELTIIVAFGSILFLFWIRALVRETGYWVPYMPVTGWAVMGAYFCILQLFEHAG